MAIAALKSQVKNIVPRPFITMVRTVYHFGTARRCVVCGNRVRHFKPQGFGYPVLEELQVVGGMYKEDDTCPICYANDRVRLVYLYVRHHSDLLTKPNKLLHVAPEDGLSALFLKMPALSYFPADFDGRRYRHIPGLNLVDIQKIQFPDACFDWVICNHVIEHVPNDRLAMQELFRVLVPGGRAILQVPLSLKLSQTLEDASARSSEDRVRVYGQGDHVRLYANDYYDKLADVGFSVEKWDAFTTDPLRAAEWKLNPLEKLCIVTKPA